MPLLPGTCLYAGLFFVRSRVMFLTLATHTVPRPLQAIDPVLADEIQSVDGAASLAVMDVAILALHCVARDPRRRPNMSTVVASLTPLVRQVAPAGERTALLCTTEHYYVPVSTFVELYCSAMLRCAVLCWCCAVLCFQSTLRVLRKEYSESAL